MMLSEISSPQQVCETIPIVVNDIQVRMLLRLQEIQVMPMIQQGTLSFVRLLMGYIVSPIPHMVRCSHRQRMEKKLPMRTTIVADVLSSPLSDSQNTMLPENMRWNMKAEL